MFTTRGNIDKPKWILFAAALALSVWAQEMAWADAGDEQMIVFVQSGRSEVDDVFQREQLPEIVRVATSMGVKAHTIEAGKEAPQEVAITPLIVYQNYRGRSIYQGRTTTPDRIRNFIRTSRFIPQGATPNHREDILIWKNGRTRLWAPLKISSVTGTPPDGYDDAAFKAEAAAVIRKNLKHFRLQKIADLGRADRGFYMDFYPWRAEDDTLFLSMALYSQFHCKEPVFEVKKPPLIGPWKHRRKLFARAAAMMEEAIVKQINSPMTGDAFDPVKKKVPEISWESIGFALPPAPEKKEVLTTAAAELTQKWVLAAPGPDDPPMIQFRFPAPLDNYAGEVKKAKGEVSLSPTLALDGTTGFVEVDTRRGITMGEPVLDEAITGSALLGSRAFPTSTFEIESISSDGQPITYGSLTPASVSGTFTLKGKRVPLSTIAEFEPVIGEDSRPRLLIRTAFSIDLRTFDIEGADGPAPAKYTLLFDINLQLTAKPSG